jgi:anti-sigma factor ChrR (cupin superfamily)
MPERAIGLNADLGARVAVHDAPWRPSPIAGVERRMLDRIGDEVARATSIVRYAPGARFARHVHGGGEEFLVLDGVFSDEHGDFPVGTYVRNPPGSAHAPRSEPGCTILVKLWQFDPGDRRAIRLATGARAFAADVARPGVAVLPLFEDARERVRLERWSPGAAFDLPLPGGGELLVLDGGFVDGDEAFKPTSWLRLPCGAHLRAIAGADGCRLWVKTGHLAHARTAPPRVSFG